MLNARRKSAKLELGRLVRMPPQSALVERAVERKNERGDPDKAFVGSTGQAPEPRIGGARVPDAQNGIVSV